MMFGIFRACVMGIVVTFLVLSARPASAIPIVSVVSFLANTATIGSAAVDLTTKFAGVPFGKAQVTVSASETGFSLGFIGTSFAFNHTGTFTGTTSRQTVNASGNTVNTPLWKWGLTIFEDAGVFSDELTISGFVEHLFNPHASDTLPAPNLAFSTIVNAGNAVNTPAGLKVSATDAPKQGTHPANDIDKLTRADLSATVSQVGLVIIESDITAYTFNLAARHIRISEPAAFILLATGLIGLSLVRRRGAVGQA